MLEEYASRGARSEGGHMFKKWLSSIGLIGGAKVDTRLVSESFVPGEQVSGEVLITGGEDAQEFDKIYLAVVTYYKHDDSVHEHAVATTTRRATSPWDRGRRGPYPSPSRCPTRPRSRWVARRSP
jgi:sporulation-control protein spo0M